MISVHLPRQSSQGEVGRSWGGRGGLMLECIHLYAARYFTRKALPIKYIKKKKKKKKKISSRARKFHKIRSLKSHISPPLTTYPPPYLPLGFAKGNNTQNSLAMLPPFAVY